MLKNIKTKYRTRKWAKAAYNAMKYAPCKTQSETVYVNNHMKNKAIEQEFRMYISFHPTDEQK